MAACAERRDWARVRSGTLIGFAGAFGAFGGVGIKLALQASYDRTGTKAPAFWIFLLCYIGATMLARVRYVRPPRTGVADRGRGRADSRYRLR